MGKPREGKAQAPTPAADRVVSVEECMRALSLSRPSVYKLMAGGHLEWVQILGVRRVKESSLLRLMDRGTAPR